MYILNLHQINNFYTSPLNSGELLYKSLIHLEASNSPVIMPYKIEYIIFIYLPPPLFLPFLKINNLCNTTPLDQPNLEIRKILYLKHFTVRNIRNSQIGFSGFQCEMQPVNTCNLINLIYYQ